MPTVTNPQIFIRPRGRGGCGVPQGQHVRPMLQPAAAAEPDIVDEVLVRLYQTRSFSVIGWHREGRLKAAEIVTLCRREVGDADLVAAMRAELVEQEERHDRRLEELRDNLQALLRREKIGHAPIRHLLATLDDA